MKIEIKFDEQTNQVLVGSQNNNNWMDLGLAIEGIGVLMAIERNKKYESARKKDIDTKDKLTDYVIDYIKRVADDYDKSFQGIPMPDFKNNNQ